MDLDLKEQIKWDFRKELDKIIKDVRAAEWQEIEDFDAIVDNATYELSQIISFEPAYLGCYLTDIMDAVQDLICEGFHDW